MPLTVDHLPGGITARARRTTPAGPLAGGERLAPITPVRDFPAVPAPMITPALTIASTVAVDDRSDLIARIMNVTIAGIALCLLAPICVIVAIIVRLTSRGPVFYTQTRVGLDRRWKQHAGEDDRDDRRVDDLGGQPFPIFKFRSMRVDAEANGQAVWATKHDNRVTPVGRVLRKTRLDEIPQLVNVLRGEMNIVGPRPERPSIVVRLRTDIPEYQARHRVKPGITGWAQINHSYDSCLEDVRKKVMYDLQYIERRSIWFDLRIMVLTIPVMVFKRGAH